MVRVASSPTECVEKRAAGRVDGCHLNWLNAVVNRETGIVRIRAWEPRPPAGWGRGGTEGHFLSLFWRRISPSRALSGQGNGFVLSLAWFVPAQMTAGLSGNLIQANVSVDAND